MLQQRPKPRPAAPPTRPIIRTLTSFDLRRLELQIQEGSGPIEGAKAIISYDHHNVLDSCRLSLPQRMQLGSRHATGEKGKLSVLRALVRLDTPLFHIDDSAEVIEEFRQFLSVTPSCVWKIIGISVPRKRVIPGVIYCRNVGEALSTILERTGLSQA